MKEDTTFYKYFITNALERIKDTGGAIHGDYFERELNLNRTEVKSIITEIVLNKEKLILSDDSGYYIPTKYSQCDRPIQRLRSMAVNTLDRAKKIEEMAFDMFGNQPTLF